VISEIPKKAVQKIFSEKIFAEKDTYTHEELRPVPFRSINS